MVRKATDFAANHGICITIAQCHGGNNGTVGAEKNTASLDRDSVSSRNLVIVARVLLVLIVAAWVDYLHVFSESNSEP